MQQLLGPSRRLGFRKKKKELDDFKSREKKDVAEHSSMFRVRMKVIVEESVQVGKEEKV